MLWNDEFVFLHQPKCAGTSLTRYMIEAWRGPIYGTVTKGERWRLKALGRSDLFLNAGSAHQDILTAKALLEKRGRRIEDFRAVFVCVLNPYDLLVSWYLFLQKINPKNMEWPTFSLAYPYDLALFLYSYMRRRNWTKRDPLFRLAHKLPFEEFAISFRERVPRESGHRFLTLGGAKLENLRYMRFETLDKDLDLIAKMYDFRPATLRHLNATPHGHYSEYVKTPCCEKAIYEAYSYFFDSGLYPRLDHIIPYPKEE